LKAYQKIIMETFAVTPAELRDIALEKQEPYVKIKGVVL